MAKPTNPPHTWAVQDALKLRGKIYTRTLNGQVIIQAWPKARGKPKSIYQAAWVDWFAKAARASKLASPEYRDQLIEQTKGTGLYWRDLVEMAMRGKLIVYPGQYKVSVPTASVYQSIAQNLSSGVWTPLTFNTKEWDTNGFVVPATPNFFTIQTAGLYLFTAWLQYTTTGGTGPRWMTINVPGYGDIAVAMQGAVSGANVHQTIVGMAYLERGKTVNCWVNCGQASQSVKLSRFTVIGMTPETIM